MYSYLQALGVSQNADATQQPGMQLRSGVQASMRNFR
jgi:hypothetical protein